MTKRSRIYFERLQRAAYVLKMHGQNHSLLKQLRYANSSNRHKDFLYPLQGIHTTSFGSFPVGFFLLDDGGNLWGSKVPMPPCEVPKPELGPTHYQVTFKFDQNDQPK
jgi:hypothetical protein